LSVPLSRSVFAVVCLYITCLENRDPLEML
jgi:hypothetical protein